MRYFWWLHATNSEPYQSWKTRETSCFITSSDPYLSTINLIIMKATENWLQKTNIGHCNLLRRQIPGCISALIVLPVWESHTSDVRQKLLVLQNLQKCCLGLNQQFNRSTWLFWKISNSQCLWEKSKKFCNAQLPRGKIYSWPQAVQCLTYGLKNKHLHAVYILTCFMQQWVTFTY